MASGIIKINTICPGCFSQFGHSVVMQEREGLYICPINTEHKYKRNSEGFFEKTELW